VTEHSPPPAPPHPVRPTYREQGVAGGFNFWSLLVYAVIGLAALLVLTVLALGVAWAFVLLIGLFP
jgi:hypothetical protein